MARLVAGDDVGEIAREAGVAEATVYEWVKQAGALPPKKALARARDQLIDEAVALVASGMSVPDAAATLGMSPGALYQRLAKVGVLTELQQKPRITPQQKADAVARVLAGEPVDKVAAAFDRSANSVYRWVQQARQEKAGGNRDASQRADTPEACTVKPPAHSKVDSVPAPMKTQAGHAPADYAEDRVKVGRGVRLSYEDRLTIQHGCSQGMSARQIATLLGRHHSVISREIARNGWEVVGEDGEATVYYNARQAGLGAKARACRPKVRKLDDNPALRAVVVTCLARRWSPGRISVWLQHAFADDESMRISHEAIYSALYIQGKGSLRAELEAVMKTQDVLIRGGKRRKARPRNAGVLTGKPWIKGAEITKRSPEADDRAIPGHWEGDLVIGTGGKSALITLVERTSRYTLLGHLPTEHTSMTVIETIQQMVKDLNAEQLKTITWDQGVEMAETARVRIKDGCEVYFCDPHAPWQRPTNENTNGEIRRRFYKKGTDFAEVTPEHVAWVQDELNDTPRQVLGGATPREILQQIFNRGALTA
ncbi:Transposase [Corynebacterium afermentans subsp. afermentans]|nr:Transposase [Corynebacterium afermentans subsp. afermentans]